MPTKAEWRAAVAGGLLGAEIVLSYDRHVHAVYVVAAVLVTLVLAWKYVWK